MQAQVEVIVALARKAASNCYSNTNMAESAHTAFSGASRLTTDAPLPVKPEDYPKPTEEALEFIETVGKHR